jgi:crossover junction endodeoxyribonuclease RuvC
MDHRGAYVAHLAMPTLKVGTRNRVNGAALMAFFEQYRETRNHAFLELVGTRPQEGAVGAFSFGHSTGLVQGVLYGLAIPHTLITPDKWKRKNGLSGTDKDAARSRAIQLYPDVRALDLKAKGQALADALLIARAGLLEL